MDDLLRILSVPRRRAILWAVWDAERAAGEIHAADGEVTFGAVSQHLKVLLDAGLVEVRRAGKRRLYRARKDALGPLRTWLESTWDGKLGELTLLAEDEERRSRRRRKK